MTNRSLICCLIVSVIALVMAGCGGESGGGVTTLTGVAAAGAPLSGTVYLKDSSTPAQERSVATAADGSFSFDLKSLAAPFLLKAVGTSNGNSLTLFSFAGGAGVANLNPLSHLAVAEANGSDYLEGLYNAPSPAKMQAIKTALPDAVTNVRTVLYPTLAKFGAAGVNFITDPYVANHQGLDLLLDMAAISTGNGFVTIIDKIANNTIQMPLSDFKSGSIDIISDPPTAAGSVLVWPVSVVAPNSEITFTAIVVGAAEQHVTWSVAEENGGSITSAGVYTTPAIPGTYHVRATNAADATKSATATVTVAGTNYLSIVPVGPGVFTVQANKLANVAGIKLEIVYDADSLTSPLVMPGEIVSGCLTAVNTAVPGILAWAVLSTGPIPDTGTLATISFNLMGVSPGAILSVTVQAIDNKGRPVATTVSLSNPVPIPTAGTTTPAPGGSSAESSVPLG